MGSGTGTVLNGPELGPLKNNALDCAVLLMSPFSSSRLARIRPPDANTASVGFHEAEVLAHWFLGRHSGAARRTQVGTIVSRLRPDAARVERHKGTQAELRRTGPVACTMPG